MNEAETRAEHIDPALKAAGWGVVEGAASGGSIRSRPALDEDLDEQSLDGHKPGLVRLRGDPRADDRLKAKGGGSGGF
jgi:hypothetical protein